MEIENFQIPNNRLQIVENDNNISKPVTSQEVSLNVEEIQTWLSFYIAEKLDFDFEQIQLEESFSYYGLDSAMGVRLIGDLGDWLDRKLSPMILYNYPTIASLAQYLAE